jgi:hypothetical protein
VAVDIEATAKFEAGTPAAEGAVTAQITMVLDWQAGCFAARADHQKTMVYLTKGIQAC